MQSLTQKMYLNRGCRGRGQDQLAARGLFSFVFHFYSLSTATGRREKLQEKYLVVVFYLLAVPLPSPAAGLPCWRQDRASWFLLPCPLPPLCRRNTVPGRVSALVLPFGEGICRPGAGKEMRPYFFEPEARQCPPLGAACFSP